MIALSLKPIYCSLTPQLPSNNAKPLQGALTMQGSSNLYFLLTISSSYRLRPLEASKSGPPLYILVLKRRNLDSCTKKCPVSHLAMPSSVFGISFPGAISPKKK